MTAIKLIVGLGNPGSEYAGTRHNAGWDWVEDIADKYSIRLAKESKYSGFYGRGDIAGQEVKLLIPTTFMNLSGQSVGAVANFFKIEPAEILVAHDELDLLPGVIRLKTGGGHGGHNGLRDMIKALANQNSFHRLRIGIGHPGDAKRVADFVLKRAPSSEQDLMDKAMQAALDQLEAVVKGDIAKAMNQLNGFKA